MTNTKNAWQQILEELKSQLQSLQGFVAPDIVTRESVLAVSELNTRIYTNAYQLGSAIATAALDDIAVITHVDEIFQLVDSEKIDPDFIYVAKLGYNQGYVAGNVIANTTLSILGMQ